MNEQHWMNVTVCSFNEEDATTINSKDFYFLKSSEQACNILSGRMVDYTVHSIKFTTSTTLCMVVCPNFGHPA